MDRAVHPATTQQRRVGCVHDGVDPLLGDVALHQFDPHVVIVPSGRAAIQKVRMGY